MFARAHGPSNPGLVKTARPAPDAGGNRAGAAPSRTARAAPGSLDQWSRPSARAPGALQESPIPMPSRSVRPAGKRHSHGGYVAGADAPNRPDACQGCTGQWQCASGSWCRLPRRSKRLIRWALSSVRASGEATGVRRDGGSVRRMLTCPASWGEDGHSRAGCPDPAGFLTPGTVAPRRGCVRPGWPTAGHRWQRPAGADAGEERSPAQVPGQRRPVAEGSAGTAPGNSGCGLSMPRRCPHYPNKLSDIGGTS